MILQLAKLSKKTLVVWVKLTYEQAGWICYIAQAQWLTTDVIFDTPQATPYMLLVVATEGSQHDAESVVSHVCHIWGLRPR